MPRRLRSNLLETRTARLKLARRTKPHWFKIADRIALGYRRNENAGSWSVRCADGAGSNWIKSFAIADDHENSDGSQILDFWQAAEKAKLLARGQDAEAGRPATVAEAIRDYERDLKVRGGNPENARRLLNPLPPSLLSKPVSMLTVKELRHWRNGLAEEIKASSANRLTKVLKAALNLAASHDERITNRAAWATGLALIPEDDDTESNLVLTDEQRRDLIASAEALSPQFGLYVWTHVETGARTSQLALLDVGDLHAGKEPKLLVPSSLKGRNRRSRTRKPVPISAGLAVRLQQAAAGRDAAAPLLVNPEGERWSARQHRRPFAEAAQAAALPDGASMYALRHTAITRALLAGVPVRLVASSFDTSVAMLEKTYSKNISSHGDELMRRALFDVTAPAAGNVVELRR